MDEDKEYYPALRRMYQKQADRALVEEFIESIKPIDLSEIKTVNDLLERIEK